jgi:hypothetical protein
VLPADREQIARHRRAVELAEALVADFPGVAEFGRLLASVAAKTASMLLVEDPAGAGRLAKRAVAVAEALAGERPDGEFRRFLCDTAMKAAGVLLVSDPEAARRTARCAVAVAEELAAERADEGRGPPTTSRARRRLLQTLWRTGAGDEALAAYTQVKAQADAHERALPERIELRAVAAEELVRAGEPARARAELVEAEALLHRLEATREAENGSPGRGPGDPGWGLATALAAVYGRLGDLASEPEELRASDRARGEELRAHAEALRERAERRDSGRRN